MKNDIQYLKIAEIWAKSSYANKRQVGAVIVKDLTIIADGYNGTAPGFPNICEDENGETFPHVFHAETNAIMKLAKSTQSSLGATMYITIPPCLNCAKIIVQAGIVRVVYGTMTNKTEGTDFLIQAGVLVQHVYERGTMKITTPATPQILERCLNCAINNIDCIHGGICITNNYNIK